MGQKLNVDMEYFTEPVTIAICYKQAIKCNQVYLYEDNMHKHGGFLLS